MHYAPDHRADPTAANDDSAFWRQLLYRWFVQYNPAYLLSAAFVFAGCFLWSKGIVHEGSLTSTLGIPLLTEAYAFALVGGAALLTRIGQRRPAVMLGLIFVVYQWDTTLHNEACAYLGSVGAGASLTWLAIFVAKLFAVSWALRIRIQRRMLAAALLGALGLTLLPRMLTNLEPRYGGALLATWLFGLISLHDRTGISSDVSLDAWGQTVLQRVTRAVWLLSAALVTLHVFIWCSNVDISLAPIFLVLPLLVVPRLRTEKKVWAVVVATLALTALVVPGAFFVVAILTSAALALRVMAPEIFPSSVAATPQTWQRTPYRTNKSIAEPPENKPIQLAAAEMGPAERIRYGSAALFSAYLGLWTMRWTHGAWPHHFLMLDATLTLMVVLAVWRSRARVPFVVPLTITYVHFLAQSRLIPVPASTVAWGESAVGLGFALLAAALFVSYKLRTFEVARE